MRAWVLDMLAIVVGVSIAEVVIQLYITPAIAAHTGSKKDAPASLPF